MARSGGRLLIEALEEQGVERAFCVPGESYLEALDALKDSKIRLIVARQEGGAAMMAEAEGKMSGRPGICFVTRGPGATNASAGVHVARQDSTPMILFVGQVERAHLGREAFQEADMAAFFGPLAKWAATIPSADRIPEYVSRAFHVAMSGRPGPVVLALPEDMLVDPTEAAAPRRVEAPEQTPSVAQIEWVRRLLSISRRPTLIAGGSRWTPEAVRALRAISERWMLPVACSFRRQGLFDNQHPLYAGHLGLGLDGALRRRVEASDLVILLGGRFSEIPSQGYELLKVPSPDQRLIHIHPDPDELGRVYAPNLPICATPGGFLGALHDAEGPPSTPVWAAEAAQPHAAYEIWSALPETTPGPLTMEALMAHLRETAPNDAITTNGAGNYAAWLHRHWRWRRYGTQVAPTSGSMGYGLPAAIAAKLRHPKREALCFAGDGCWQMTMQELGTAAQEGAAVLALICDNGQYGMIRMHQERAHPGRQSGTALRNPDFAAIAQAYGVFGRRVERNEDLPEALAAARAATAEGRPAVLHLILDPEAISPGRRLEPAAEAAAEARPEGSAPDAEPESL